MALLVIAAIGTGSAHACRTRKPGVDASRETLVVSEREVYVAEVVRAAESVAGQVVHEFTVPQHLAGP
ncbi:hypothetical protein [uncultured Massilia sp.]|uniref:hypothetical protein n=1 Tax=uncultured Massilia sp. TaxID=169973 RepID=UPI00258C3FFB|nr:hypothetical protein [uncultured Massilia sp.]